MKSTPLLRLLRAMVLGVTLALPSAVVAADAPPKDGQSIINGLRLKKWTKDLDLSADQQKKVQVLLDDEAKEVAKLNGDASVGPAERSAKVSALHEGTYGKMKPLLNATQLEAFEKLLAKSKPKKKSNAPAK